MKFEWRESNKQPYLFVDAEDHYLLGVGVGRGLKEQIGFMHKSVLGMLMKAGIKKEMLISLANEYKKFIPDNYLQEIKGMHEGYTRNNFV